MTFCMATKENLNPLKTLVFSMGLLLIGGTVLLGRWCGKKYRRKRRKPQWWPNAQGEKWI